MEEQKEGASLLFQDDFVFQRSDNDEEDSDDINPDVVDAIYAQMYFQPDTPNRTGTVASHVTSGIEENSTTQLTTTTRAVPDFNVSVVMDDSNKKYSQHLNKRKKKNQDKVTSSLQNGGAEIDHDEEPLKHDNIVILISSSDDSRSDDDRSINAESASSSSEKGVADMTLCSEDDDDDDEQNWKICLKDKMGREAYDSAYGGSNMRNKHVQKCNNCKQKGHFIRNCPWPKRHQVCYLCAGLNHISSMCPCDLCPYCYQPKHRGRSCKSPWAKSKTQCSRCFMTGHHASICPDQWRQFHNTTHSSDVLFTIPGHLQRNLNKVFCYNCGLEGHYGFECTRTRPRGWPLPHLLLIARYDQMCWPPSIHHLRQDSHHQSHTKNIPCGSNSTSKKKWKSKDNHKPIHERSLSMDGAFLTNRDVPYQSEPLLPTPPHRHVYRSQLSYSERVHYDHFNPPSKQHDLRQELNKEHDDFPRTPLFLPPSSRSSSGSRHDHKRKRSYDEDDRYGNRHSKVSPLIKHQRIDSHAHHLPHPSYDHDRRYSDYNKSSTSTSYHDTHHSQHSSPQKRQQMNGEDYMVSSRGFHGSMHTATEHHHRRSNSSRY